MKTIITQVITKEIDIAIAVCNVFARYWEDSTINGQSDNARNPKMPCTELVEWYGTLQLAWSPEINLDNGQILNWTPGMKAELHYKSCDENMVKLYDRTGNLVHQYAGYVPNFLCPIGEGFGDYVKMEIDERGFIKNFNPDLSDIFAQA